MNVVVSISYYYPNISGLTVYAKRLAEGLASRGHRVMVLTSRHDRSLPKEEILNGVKVRRSWILFRIGKGVVMPFLPFEAFWLIRKADAVNCHLPQFESFVLAVIGRLLGKRVVLTHHTDLSGWRGWFNRLAEGSVWVGQLVAGLFADKIVPYTKDYADHSWYLRLFRKKLDYCFPPILAGKPDPQLKKKWSKKIDRTDCVIGFAGRIARQKGIPHLLKAIPLLTKELPSFKIVFAGPYKEVIGERYFEEIDLLVKKYQKFLLFLGAVEENQMATFYRLCDVLVLPSDDTLESFGIVQVEAMLNGCPVVASDLPGVRVPILLTGMGRLSSVADSAALAVNMVKVIKNKKQYIKSVKEVARIFSYEENLEKYEKLIKK